jgi:hypothetical protein
MNPQTKSWCRAALALALLLWIWPGSSRADMITYDVTVNTSSVSGTMGSLDFQFNPSGLGPDVLQAVISSFTGGTLVGSPTLNGDASGSLISPPSAVTLKDDTGLNEAIQDFNYGSAFSFKVTFSALSGSLASANPGAQFSLTLYDGRGATGNQLLSSSDPSGAALLIDFNPNGVTNSSDVTAVPEGPGPSGVPEPASILLAGLGAAGLASYRGLRKRAR